jgi:hypothetical protein
LPERPIEKGIYDQCLEYLVYAWLKSETIRSISHQIPHKTLELKDFPERLKENVFLKAFPTIEPIDIVERALSQVWLEVPTDMRTKIDEDQHTGRIAFKGRYCDISVSYGIRGLWPVQSMRVSPGEPRLLETPINPFFLRDLEAKLSELATLDSMLIFEAKFHNSRLRYLLCRERTEQYMAWAIELVDGFANFFDFDGLRARAVAQTQRELFDIVKGLDSKIDRLMNKRRRTRRNPKSSKGRVLHPR